MPELPPELDERPGIKWLYVCSQSGLKPDDLKSMRIDQAEAWIELHEFIQDAIEHRDEDEKNASAEKAFWDL